MHDGLLQRGVQLLHDEALLLLSKVLEEEVTATVAFIFSLHFSLHLGSSHYCLQVLIYLGICSFEFINAHGDCRG